MKRVLSLFVLLMLLSTSTAHSLSWAYQFVVWNGNVYEVKEERVQESEIGRSLGEVETQPNDITGNYYGDASNAYPKGTKYFEIVGTPTKTAIAVQVKENQWQKAIYVHKAPFHWRNLFTKIPPIILVLTILMIVVTYYKQKNKPLQGH